MVESPRLVLTGTLADNTPVYADVTFLDPSGPVAVQLSQDYTQACPPAWPFRPSQTGVDAADLSYPRTIPSGTTMRLLRPAADALVQANGASYV
jgi:hypothetical protein